MRHPIHLLLAAAALASLATPQDAADPAAPAAPGDAAAAAPDTPDERPNILLIFADDQRVDTIGAWGNPAIRTPNMDRIAAEGVSFRRSYCMGSSHGAVCAPSRAMLHTGRAYHSIDHGTMDGCRTLGELLGESGFRTFGTGKWHNGRASFSRSFQSGREIMFGGMSDHNHVPVVDMVADGEFGEKRHADGHSSDVFSAAAVDFISSAPDDAPFFCYVAFTAPHDPRDPPLEWRDRERPPLPGNFRAQHEFDNGFLKVRDEKLGAWPRDPEVVRDQLAEYYGLIEHLDAAVGRVLGAVDARGDGRDTIVVYAADHGLAVGSHGLLGKQSVYEHSLRAPMMISGPGIPAGQHLTALTYLYDLYPTLLSLVDVAVEEPIHGEDLRPLWDGDVTQVRDSLYLSMGKTQRAVTDGRFKLCVYPKVGHRQLFDLAADPLETMDLAGNPAYGAHIARLERELATWRRVTGDPDPLVVEELAPLRVDLTGAKRQPDRWQPEWIREKYFDPPEEAPAAEGASAPPAAGGADAKKEG
ncbi:MAG: sulfatase-like hydrolase/transferase [Planctomycetota bacterium]|jgi:arylsulfatase A-like enzyme